MRALINFFAVLFSLLLLQCNYEPRKSASQAQDSVYVDSTATAGVEIIRADSSVAVRDTLTNTVDSTSKEILPENNNDTATYPVYPQQQQQQQIQQPRPVQTAQPKSAVLGYSYFADMKWKEVKNINVFVSTTNPRSLILDTLRKIVQKQAMPKSDDSATVKLDTQNISFYQYVTVTLIDPAKAFEITPVFSLRQQINLQGSNRWRWTVQPVTNSETATLIMKITGETPPGAPIELDDITIPIVIHLKSSWLRNTWIFLQENPEFLLSAILIPLLAYFGKKLFDKFLKTT